MRNLFLVSGVLFVLFAFATVSAQDSAERKSIHQMQHEEYAGTEQPQEIVSIMPGIENLLANHINELKGQSVGLVINHTAVDKDTVHLVDRLMQEGIEVNAIFGPEHGYRGDAADGQKIKDGVDPVTGAKVYSLYGPNRKPSPEMLEGLDVILYDIQDVGVRFYTYISTMGYAMQAAAEQGIEFWVLDRPNPITGTKVDGPPLRESYESFVGLYPIPVRYGMTPGELAKMIVGEQWLEFPKDFTPRVINLSNWERHLWLDETDAPWVAPSPNMSRLSTATVYPGLCFVEGTNISEGRGTDHPFEWIGAPWIDAEQLAQELNKKQVAGVVFEPITYTPEDIPGRALNSKYRGEECEGVAITVTERDKFEAVRAGVEIITTVQGLYPAKFHWRKSSIDRLYGSDDFRAAVANGKTSEEIFGMWKTSLEDFKKAAAKYYLY